MPDQVRHDSITWLVWCYRTGRNNSMGLRSGLPLDVFAGRADFHLVAEARARLFEALDKRRQVRSAKHHAMPSALL